MLDIAFFSQVETEVQVMNTDSYKWNSNWATVLQILIDDNQLRNSKEDKNLIKDWQEELKELRCERFPNSQGENL